MNNINLKDIPDIPYGELDSEGARVLNRIYNTLQVDNDGLKVQWDTPTLLAKASNISKEKAAAILCYLTDNDLAYYSEESPGLYLNYQALPDKYRKKYSQ